MEIRLNMQINKLSKDMQMSINFGTMNCFVGSVLSLSLFAKYFNKIKENNKNFDKTWWNEVNYAKFK